MKNYTKLCQYARKFTGDALAKDLVHNLWLRKMDSGVDILSEKLPNNEMFLMVKCEFLNSFKRKNEKVHANSTDLNQDKYNQDGHWIDDNPLLGDRSAVKDSVKLMSLSDCDPTVFLDFQQIDNIVRGNIQSIIDSYGQSDPRSTNAAKYSPETIMRVYELIKQDCSVKEISELLDVGEQSIRNYKKKIVEICKFLKPSNSSSR